MIRWRERSFEADRLEDLPVVARIFLEEFPDGGVFRVHGEMAAGKTTWIAQICVLLGIQNTSSPTFSIVNEYQTADHRSVFHFDLYRVKNENELAELGFDAYFLRKPFFVFIEWPDVANHLIPEEAIDLYLTRNLNG